MWWPVLVLGNWTEINRHFICTFSSQYLDVWYVEGVSGRKEACLGKHWSHSPNPRPPSAMCGRGAGSAQGCSANIRCIQLRFDKKTLRTAKRPGNLGLNIADPSFLLSFLPFFLPPFLPPFFPFLPFSIFWHIYH